ncbi:hypothetical protein PRK78_006976 [Emydomyces testavorans]|uniref:Major facilitator superfamily (MFS) profile domain-containing protein n=1 Tax=Emydomyces testavorans TaxID=2070801 RepID=A0AAF0DMD6_9EURO|nr:hypothetical protein PRK78_006976 [Emydomyces testavorans]
MAARPRVPRRRSSTSHYHTFSTPPPTSRGRPPSNGSTSFTDGSRPLSDDETDSESFTDTPIPIRQMLVLALIALCEQTALNSIGPYLPDMASSFPEIEHSKVGMYVGTIASSFALAQFVTNYFWGWLSDRIGRKPVILLGTILTAACFVAFGFCKTLWQAIVVQLLMGIVNGNQGVVSTCLGEITDRSNQSRAFTYLPIIYGIGGITGPILGGLLVTKNAIFDERFPYLGPNLASAAILIVDFMVASFYLEESHEDPVGLPTIGKKVRDLFTWLWQFTSSTRPSYLRRELTRSSRRSRRQRSFDSEASADTDVDSSTSPLFGHRRNHEELTCDEMLNRDIILLLITYLIFALSNVSYNSLYPIFAQAPPPVGRALGPQEIGLSLAFAGIVTIVFQVCIFSKLRDKMGNRWSYRAGLFGFVISFALMPFVGYKDQAALNGKLSKNGVLLAIELCLILLLKTISTVGGLTSALLLITNSAPDNSVLGALNGLAQTLSAAGRAAGPFLSGSLFSLATKVQPKGEALAFGVFGGIAFVGFLLSFGIRSRNLEADGWREDHNDNDDDNDDDLDKSDDERGRIDV